MLEYRVDVSEILGETGASIEIDDALDMGELTVGDERFVLKRPAAFRVSVTDAGAGIVAHGDISAAVTTTCSRCLCEFDDVIRGEVVGFYTRPGESAEDEDAEELDAEGTIDLGPALRAALVIEAPFAPLHDESCAGLCATCGADLNAGPCECHQPTSDAHPFSGLSGLLGEDADDSRSGESDNDA